MQATVGGAHTSLLASDGTVFACGRNNYGQLGVGDVTDRTEPTKMVMECGRAVKHISVGRRHTMYTTVDGALCGSGLNSYGQLGILDSEYIETPTQIVEEIKSHRVVSTASGFYYTLCILEDGLLFAFGDNVYGQLGVGDLESRRRPTLVETMSGKHVLQIAAGHINSACITKDGAVFAWGMNDFRSTSYEREHKYSQDYTMEKIPVMIKLV